MSEDLHRVRQEEKGSFWNFRLNSLRRFCHVQEAQLLNWGQFSGKGRRDFSPVPPYICIRGGLTVRSWISHETPFSKWKFYIFIYTNAAFSVGQREDVIKMPADGNAPSAPLFFAEVSWFETRCIFGCTKAIQVFCIWNAWFSIQSSICTSTSDTSFL